MKQLRHVVGILASLLFLLSGCTEANPNIEAMVSLSGPTFSGSSAKEYSITATNQSVTVTGECDKRVSDLKISLDDESTWQDPPTTGADLDCSDGAFSFIITDPGALMGFVSGISETKFLKIRGQSLLGKTAASVVSVTYDVTVMATLSGEPTGINNWTSLGIAVGGTGITHYAYKVGASSSTDCSVAAGYSTSNVISNPIADNISAVADGGVRICVIGFDGTTWQAHAAATSATWTKDTTSPLISITSPAAGYRSQNGVTVDGTCETGINVILTGDITGAPVTASCSAGAFSQFVTFSTGDAAKSVTATQTDTATNFANATRSFIKDSIGPGVTINQRAAQVDPTNSLPVEFDVVFSEAIDASSFVTGDIVNSGTASVTTWTITDTGDATNFILRATVIGVDGTVTPSLAVAAVQDVALNQSSASTSTDNSVTYDSIAPMVTFVTSTAADGPYGATSIIPIQVAFNEPVIVTLSGGNVRLSLETGTIDRNIVSPTGSGTTTLTFSYYINPGDFSTDLDYLSTTALAPYSGATITDAAGNPANVTLAAPGSAGSLGAAKNIQVVGTPAGLSISGSGNFSEVLVGNSTIRDFTILNTGGYPATISNDGAGLNPPYSFAGGSYPGSGGGGSGTCTGTLNPGADCIVSVQLSPTASDGAGPFNETLVITYNNGLTSGHTASTALTGTSNPAPKIGAVSCMRNIDAYSAYSCSAAASGISDPGDSAPAWSITSNSCAFAINIDSGGNISGSPTDAHAGVCEFSVQVDDGVNGDSDPWKVQVEVLATTGLSNMDAGYSHNCAVLDGNVMCWGSNSAGALGANKTPAQVPASYSPLLVEVSGAPGTLVTDARQVTAGSNFSCARFSTGTAKCWGVGTSGELGNGASTNQTGASTVSGTGGTGSLANILNIQAGNQSACALLTGGGVYCWGRNDNGKLGANLAFGSTYNYPQQVLLSEGGTLSGAIQIAVGRMQSCALMRDHTIRCWGDGASGQLGQESGPGEYSGDAVKVNGFGGDDGYQAVAISASDSSVCALLDSGEVKCWGDNSYGDLGIGSMTDVGNGAASMSSLASVNLGTNAKALSSGDFHHNCAILADNTLRCWGYNFFGELGLGNNLNLGDNEAVNTAAVIDLGTGATPTAISAGYSHTCATVSQASQIKIVCWGKMDADYQLGWNPPNNVGDQPAEMGAALVPVYFGPTAVVDRLSTFFDYTPNLLGISRNAGTSGVVKVAPAPLTFERRAGKYYFEVTVGSGLGSGDMRVGLINSLAPMPSGGLGTDGPVINSCGFDFLTRRFNINGGPTGPTIPSPVNAGEVIGFAIDLDVSPPTMTVVRAGGNIQTYGCSLSGAPVVVVPAASLRYSGQSLSFNFGASPFSHYGGLIGWGVLGYSSGWYIP